MSQNRQYTEVSGGSNNERWEPQKSTLPINPQQPPMLEGYYKKQREQTGQNGAFLVHEIATVNMDGTLGNEYDVSGGVALDDMLDKITIGTFVCIQYLGKVPSKQGGRTYNNWKVFKDDNAIPYQNLKPQQTQQASTSAPIANAQAPAGGNFPQNNGQPQNNAPQGQGNWNNNPNYQANQRQQNNPAPQGQPQYPQQGQPQYPQQPQQQGQNFPQQGQNFPQQGQPQFPQQGQQQYPQQGQPQYPQNNGMNQGAPIHTGAPAANNPFNEDLPF